MKIEKRRLNDRFPVSRKAVMRYPDVPLDDTPPVTAQIIDVSIDSLTCLVYESKKIEIGARIILDVLERDFSHSIEGKVASCVFADGGQLRIGVSILPDKIDSFALFKRMAPMATIDRRNTDRRERVQEKRENRQFERRGVWQGLLSKRY